MLFLIAAGLVVWFVTHLFFQKLYRTKAIGRFVLFILQAMTTWGLYAIPLLLIYVYSEVLPPNTGYLIYPLLLTAIIGSVGGSLLTAIIANRKKS